MNIFKILSSGKHAFREEFISAFLAYLLSPKMDHGLGESFLSSLLSQVAEQNDAPDIKQLTQKLQSRLWENIFEDNGTQPIVELEVAYPRGHGHGWIDVVIRIGDYFVLIENKILVGSKTEDQIKEQYLGLQQVLKQREFEGDYKILLLYLVPAIGGEGGWSVPQSFYEELEKVDLRPHDQKALITWQPVEDSDAEPISIVGTIRELFRQESLGLMAPISGEVRQILLSLVNYAMSGFVGYHFEKATVKREQGARMPVSQILNLTGEHYIGIQYGRGGLVSTAWRNTDFLTTDLAVIEEHNGSWQYLPLEDFKTLTRWALNPESENLQKIEWSGKPFWIEGLYRVAKWCDSDFFVGLKGGVPALEAMTVEQITDRKAWEVSSVQKNSAWIPAPQFCEILEKKGLSFD